MKKYLIAAIFIACSNGQFVQAQPIKAFQKAVKLQDLQKVKKMLKANVVNVLQEDKDAYVKVADDLYGEYKKNATLGRSPKDALSFGAGVLLAGVGLELTGLVGGLVGVGQMLFFANEPDSDDSDSGSEQESRVVKHSSLIIKAVGLGLTISGCQYIYRGIRCSSALEKVARARKIKEAVELIKTVEDKQREAAKKVFVGLGSAEGATKKK